MTIEHIRTDDLSTWTLDELAAEAKKGHTDFKSVMASSVEHAVRVGRVMAEVQARLGLKWADWLVDNDIGFSRATATRYMRLAVYYHELPPHDSSAGLVALLKLLSAEPYLRAGHPRHIIMEAVTLRAAGQSLKSVARQLGVATSTVQSWVDPEYKKKRQQPTRKYMTEVRKARQALVEKERRVMRKAAAKNSSGALAESYSTLRLHIEALDRAVSEATDREVQAALRAALAFAYKAEDKIVEVLGVS